MSKSNQPIFPESSFRAPARWSASRLGRDFLESKPVHEKDIDYLARSIARNYRVGSLLGSRLMTPEFMTSVRQSLQNLAQSDEMIEIPLRLVLEFSRDLRRFDIELDVSFFAPFSYEQALIKCLQSVASGAPKTTNRNLVDVLETLAGIKQGFIRAHPNHPNLFMFSDDKVFMSLDKGVQGALRHCFGIAHSNESVSDPDTIRFNNTSTRFGTYFDTKAYGF
jgi:hypothetical protein